METIAHHKFARMGSQKLRLVADQIRGKKVHDALRLLKFSDKRAALLIRKVLESAVANAEHNNGADVDGLKVSTVIVNDGPFYKRIHARAKGRAARVTKRTSHIAIAVAE